MAEVVYYDPQQQDKWSSQKDTKTEAGAGKAGGRQGNRQTPAPEPPQDTKAAGKGKGGARQDNRRKPTLPSAKAATEHANVTTNKAEPRTPRGQDKQEGPIPDPGDLEKFYRFGLSVLGEQHPATRDAKDRWQSAIKAKQEAEQKRKASNTLEKQVHIAKERMGRLLKKIQRTETAVVDHKAAIDKAVQEHQQAIENDKAAKDEHAQAQQDYDKLVTQLKAQAGSRNTTNDLLRMVGADQDHAVSTEAEAALARVAQMLQAVAQQVAQEKAKANPEPPRDGQEGTTPMAKPSASPEDQEMGGSGQEASAPPTPAKREQSAHDEGDAMPPPNKTHRINAKGDDTPARGSVSGSTQCS